MIKTLIHETVFRRDESGKNKQNVAQNRFESAPYSFFFTDSSYEMGLQLSILKYQNEQNGVHCLLQP